METQKQVLNPTKKELTEWLEKQWLCVIATNGNDGFPNAATVAFSHNDSFDFFIITDIATRKARNINRDKHVAVTITNEAERCTLQFEGEATQLSWQEFAPQIEHHHRKLPFTAALSDIPGQTVFRITTSHAKFTDITVRPWELTEYDF